MIKSPNELYRRLGTTKKEVEKILSDLGKSYYEYSKPKKKNQPDGPRRHFTPSRAKLKIIQERLNERVFSEIKLLTCVYGGVKGKSPVANGRFHKGGKYYLKLDITNFFPSVSDKMVQNSLQARGFSKKVAAIITELTTFKCADSYRGKSLPQGAPSSPFLANLVFEKVDQKILAHISGQAIKYTRWLDDMAFSSVEDISHMIDDLASIIGKSGFSLSRKKKEYHNKRTPITGTVVSPNSITVKREFREKDETKMNKNQLMGRRNYEAQVKKANKGQ